MVFGNLVRGDPGRHHCAFQADDVHRGLTVVASQIQILESRIGVVISVHTGRRPILPRSDGVRQERQVRVRLKVAPLVQVGRVELQILAQLDEDRVLGLVFVQGRELLEVRRHDVEPGFLQRCVLWLPRLVVVHEGEAEPRRDLVAVAPEIHDALMIACPSGHPRGGWLSERLVVDQRDMLGRDSRDGPAEVEVERGHLLRSQLPELQQTRGWLTEAPAVVHDGQEIGEWKGDEQIVEMRAAIPGLVRTPVLLYADSRYIVLLARRLLDVDPRDGGLVLEPVLSASCVQRLLELLPERADGLVENPAVTVAAEKPSESPIRPRRAFITRNGEGLDQCLLMQEGGDIGHVPEGSHEAVDADPVQELLLIEITAMAHELQQGAEPDNHVIRRNDSPVDVLGESRSQLLEAELGQTCGQRRAIITPQELDALGGDTVIVTASDLGHDGPQIYAPVPEEMIGVLVHRTILFDGAELAARVLVLLDYGHGEAGVQEIERGRHPGDAGPLDHLLRLCAAAGWHVALPGPGPASLTCRAVVAYCQPSPLARSGDRRRVS